MKKNSLSLIIIALLIILAGCSMGSGASSYHKSGMKHFLKGEYVEAEGSLAKAVEINQEKAEYFIDYGFVLIKTGKIEEAQVQFKKAILNKNNKVVRENNKKAHRGIGIAYYEAGEYEKAIVYFKEALKIKEEEKLNKDLTYYIASSYEKSGNYKEALNSYDKILETNKPNAEIYELIARTKYHLGELDQALVNYDKALKFNKNVYEYYFEKYAILTEMGDIKSAKEVLSQASAIKAKTKQDHYNLGKLYYISSDYEKAKLKLQESEEDGFISANYYLGEIYQSEDDFDVAIKFYKEYIEKETNNQIVTVYSQLATCLIAKQNYEEALEVLDKGIKGNDASNLKEILYNQVIVYENLSRFEEAYKVANEYIKLCPEDKDMIREADFIQTRVLESNLTKEK